MEKEQTAFSLNQKEREMVRPEEDMEDSFSLTVTGYGTVFLTVESDHPAVRTRF